MKLGVICDGISRNLRHAVDVMDEFDLEYAELQYVGETEVGDHTAQEIAAIDQLLRDRGKPVSCLSRHIFAGMSAANRPGDALHVSHMDALKRVIEMAHIVGSPLGADHDPAQGTNIVGQEWRGALERGPWGMGQHATPHRPSGGAGQSRRRGACCGNWQWDFGKFQLYGAPV